MAAEAGPIPENLRVAIINASAATSAIRALIETTQADVKTAILPKEEFTEINNIMRDQISRLISGSSQLEQTIKREGESMLPDFIRREILSILFSYTVVNGSLDQLENDVDQGGEYVNKRDLNSAYIGLVATLMEMERQWNVVLTEIEATRAGQAVNHRGGYRKRKQRTQRKQRKQRKQKHCKTQRKTQRKRK